MSKKEKIVFKACRWFDTEKFHSQAKKYGVSFPENTSFLGCWIDKNLVGVVGYDRLNKDTVKLRSAYVLPEYRGRQIYKQLNDYRKKYLLEKGITIAKLVCTVHSERLHIKEGAILTKKFKKYTAYKYYW
jgi:hypothetical protein